jgi:hypothetical protein
MLLMASKTPGAWHAAPPQPALLLLALAPLLLPLLLRLLLVVFMVELGTGLVAAVVLLSHVPLATPPATPFRLHPQVAGAPGSSSAWTAARRVASSMGLVSKAPHRHRPSRVANNARLGCTPAARRREVAGTCSMWRWAGGAHIHMVLLHADEDVLCRLPSAAALLSSRMTDAVLLP